MLKLKLKPTYELGETEIQIYDLFVSQDLLFISGRTSSQNNVYNGEQIKIVNNNNKFIDLLTAETEDVTVKGRVFYKQDLEIKSVKKIFNSPVGVDYETSEFENTYVEYNGDICFYCEKLGGYIVDHVFYQSNKNDKILTIETYAYIEGDYAVVDGKKYYVDFSDKEWPIKDFPENYKIINVILYDRKKWKKETKFKLTKKNKTPFAIEEVLYGGYENYVVYNNEKNILAYLYKDDGSGNLENLGYGVELDGNIYTEDSINFNYVDEDIFNIHKDIDLSSSNIQLSDDDDDYLMIQSNMCTYSNGGNFMYLITKSDRLDIEEGNHILAESTNPLKIKYYIEEDREGNQYVFYNNNRYDIEENLFDYVTISGVDYRLVYDNENKTIAHAFVNGDTIEFNINTDTYEISSNGKVTCEDGGTVYFGREVRGTDLAIPTNKIYYIENGYEYVKYGKIKGYEIHHEYGVKIDDNYYRVFNEINDDDIVTDRYIEIYDYLRYELLVIGINGSKTFICTPEIYYSEISDEFEVDAEKRNRCSIIVNNIDEFTFTLRDDIFGDIKGYPENFLYESVQEESPVNFFGHLNLSLFKINSYINAKLPFISSVGNNIMKEDMINNALLDEIKDKSYGSIVDMEKDVYYPTFFDEVNYVPIREIRFNMHFRTRQLDNWKVIEDYVEINPEINTPGSKVTNMSNWFISDYSYYQNCAREGCKLQNVSDLVGYMNFTLSEVRNMAKKISKSFLRLSFYSTPDPNTQVLLGTSTVFMDEALLAKKAFTYTKAAGKIYARTQAYQRLVLNADREFYSGDSVSVDGELLNDYVFDDEYRLSSRITIRDKHNSDTSSEGFYFYMFREFANNMRPTRIYLKIDFNHAGIGKTIPLIIPRKIDGTPLYLHKSEDLEILENGFKFKDIYKQLFIPIDVIYDDKNNRYVYYMPNELRENTELGVSDDIMEFNLFEIKFKDESIQD